MKVDATPPEAERNSAGPFSFSPDLTVLAEPTSARAEAIRGLRTHLLAQHVEEGRRGMSICATSADVRTITVAANLAIAFAQVGVPCLLVDADLRAPKLADLIAPSVDLRGLGHYLVGEEGADDIVQHDVLPNLSLVYSGGQHGNAQELLASERFARIAKNWLRDYAVTIVNSPPANRYADARRISAVVGYSIVVARRNVTYVTDLKHLTSQLRGDGAKVVGTILSEE